MVVFLIMIFTKESDPTDWHAESDWHVEIGRLEYSRSRFSLHDHELHTDCREVHVAHECWFTQQTTTTSTRVSVLAADIAKGFNIFVGHCPLCLPEVPKCDQISQAFPLPYLHTARLSVSLL